MARRVVRCATDARIFEQGGQATSVFYIRSGCVKLSVRQERDGPTLHEHAEFSDRFIRHMLSRNIRIEEDLVDQPFNTSEKRLARYGKEDAPRVLPALSQETLAELVGTTRSRVSFFMNRFRTLGLIEYNGVLKINPSLLSVVLHD